MKTKRDYINENDWAPEAIEAILDLAGKMKASPGGYRTALCREVPRDDLREVLDAHAGVVRGGDVPARAGSGCFSPRATSSSGGASRSPTPRRVLSRYADGIMARTYAQATVEGLAENASVPVINGLSDLLHPCQALADFLTDPGAVRRHARFPLCYVGDGNNVAHSLMLTGAKLGARVAVVTPPGFEPAERIVAWARRDRGEDRGVDPRHALARRGIGRRPRGLHGRLGLDGAGGGGGRAGPAVRRLPRDRSSFVDGGARRDLPALPAGAPG